MCEHDFDGVSGNFFRSIFLPRRLLVRIIQRCWRSADTLSQAFGASPFRPRSMVLYLVGRHPIRPNGAYSSRPGLNETLTFPLSATSMAPLGSEARKPGRYESRRTGKLRCQRGETPQDNHCDLALEYSGYAYLPGSNGARDLRRLGVIGERGIGLLRRLEERPGFPKLEEDEYPGEKLLSSAEDIWQNSSRSWESRTARISRGRSPSLAPSRQLSRLLRIMR